jgi:integrase/recombinase XerC
MANGSFPDDVSYWVGEWLKGGRRSSDHTRAAYRRDVDEFLTYAKKNFKDAGALDILEYQSHLSGQAPRTIARKIASVRSFYRFLNNREVTNLNLGRIETPKIEQSLSRDKLLTETEVKAIIDAAEAEPIQHVFVRLLYLTAARVSEALALRWRDLTRLDGGGEAHIVGKGRKHRDVFLPEALWADLMKMRGAAEDGDLLFPALDRFKAWELIKKLGKAAKIKKSVSPHSFRHAHISHALKNGATIVEVRDQAGHANITTTSLYSHASDERATATRLKIQ